MTEFNDAVSEEEERMAITRTVLNLYGMHPVVYQYHILSFISVKHNNIPMNSLVYCCV
jgi:hypothetical protein